MHQAGYRYLTLRKKGSLHARDLKARHKFCQKIPRKGLTKEFWRTGIYFHSDGKGFQYKSNPNDQAQAPQARQWRKLKFRCTAKGERKGGINVNFMVGISYGKGVVLCEQSW